MPTGTPYNSYIPPYQIRVDDFSTPPADYLHGPLLHLLSHTHSDHVNGLSARSFGYKVICSKDAKEMLLRHEVYAERELQTLELRAEKIRTYAHLKVDPLCTPDGSVYYQGSRDLLHVLPLHTPTRFELTADESVTITLLDANHCPGAVMFLIQGTRGSVLHTGDFRAEPWFLQSVMRNPFLQPYLASDLVTEPRLSKKLEAIYLDTASVLSPFSVPSKDCATSGLVELMRLYPESVYFFINSWTWGYEDILKSIARAFQAKIHVDRYKHSIFQHISDPFLKLITTRDPSSTRFHACERFHRCEFVDVENDASYSNATSALGKRVVYVNPVTMSVEAWDEYLAITKARIQGGEEVNNLLVPLSRHSTLPELKAFISLFRPKRVVPNTLDPRLLGLDWAYIDRVFSSCLCHRPSACPSQDERPSFPMDLTTSDALARLNADTLNDGDVALKNLVGNGASVVAERWADDGKMMKRLALIRAELGEEENRLIDNLMAISRTTSSSRPVREQREIEHVEITTASAAAKLDLDTPKSLDIDRGTRHTIAPAVPAPARVPPPPKNDRNSEGEDTDDNTDDERQRGRTAHFLFAGLAGVDPADKENTWWFTSPGSSPEKRQQLLQQRGEREIGEDGSWRLNQLTPVSPSPPRLSKSSGGGASVGVFLSRKVSSTPISRGSGCATASASERAKAPSSLVEPPLLISSRVFPFSVRTPPPPPPAAGKDGGGGDVKSKGPPSPLASPFCPVSSSPDVFLAAPPPPPPPPPPNPVLMPQTGRSFPQTNKQPLFRLIEAEGRTIQKEDHPETTVIKKSDFLPSNALVTSTPVVRKRPAPGTTVQVDVIQPSKRLKTPDSKEEIVSSSSSPPPPPPAPFNLPQLPLLPLQAAAPSSSSSSSSPSSLSLSSSSSSAIIIPWVPTEREHWHRQRMVMSERVAAALPPDMVKPSFWKKRERQVKQLERKGKGKVGGGGIGATEVGLPSSPLAPPPLGVGAQASPSRPPLEIRRLVPEPTLLSFETVHDTNETEMDWNRSRMLAEAIREEVAMGRKPTIPLLQCAQSQSQ